MTSSQEKRLPPTGIACLDIVTAHAYSSYNAGEIAIGKRVGCFNCLKISEPKDIKEGTDDNQTAICPKCGIDSMIADTSGYTIDRIFLSLMEKHWFGIGP